MTTARCALMTNHELAYLITMLELAIEVVSHEDLTEGERRLSRRAFVKALDRVRKLRDELETGAHT